MGLDKGSGRKHFLSISEGSLVLQHQNPIEGVTESRTNKNGKVVHEEFFRSLTANIKDIQKREAPFGLVWELTMEDDGEEFVISWPYSSRYTNLFFRALPNVDFSKPVKFRPWTMKDEKDASKTRVGVTLYQNEEKVEFYFTKDEPNGMPELKKRKFKGKDVYDDSEQLEFFENMLEEDIRPSLNGVTEPVEGGDDAEAEDDLPF